jgi:hypothetical protein
VLTGHAKLSLDSESLHGEPSPPPQRAPAKGRVDFEWTATHHFAAVDHLRRSAKRSLLFNVAILFIPLLVGLAFVSDGNVPQFLILYAVFSALSAGAWAAFRSQPVRRFFFRYSSAVPCALEFDERGVTWAIGGKSALSYPWSRVRSIGESAEYVFVLASVCVAIPKSTFGSPLEPEYFAASMRRFLGP